MRRTKILVLGLAGLGGALAGCGDEEPTGVGSVLIGPGVTTFEVVLEAESFLATDTTFDSLGRFRDAPFRMVANDFAGELDAHTLFQITRPFTVTYQVDGVSRTDSLASIRGARITLIVDSAASTPAPLDVELLNITESWDVPTVTWSLRYDTAGESAAWTTPGGTTGPVLGMAPWTGSDTLVITLDSTAAAVFQDTAAARRGALIRTSRPGARIRTGAPRFEFDVVPVGKTDTIVPAVAATRSAHVVWPEDASAAGPTELRVGGLPSWRSMLEFLPLRDLVVDACGSGGLGTGDPECDVPLRNATLNLATLMLEPNEVAGRRLEVPIRIDARAVLTTENVPVFRSPLTSALGTSGFRRDSAYVELFAPDPPAGVQVLVPMTTFARQLLREEDPEDPVSYWLALVSSAERGTFGYASFASMESVTPPRLRLVLTVPNEELFQ